MKKLSNLKGAKTLNKQEQQNINGGIPYQGGHASDHTCVGSGAPNQACSSTDGFSTACLNYNGRCIINGSVAYCVTSGCYYRL